MLVAAYNETDHANPSDESSRYKYSYLNANTFVSAVHILDDKWDRSALIHRQRDSRNFRHKSFGKP